MDLSTSTGLMTLLQTNSYILILLLMILEGPIVTYAAAFSSSLGIFNIYIVFILAILGNIVPDVLLFLLGRKSRTKTMEKYISYFGISNSKLKKVEKGLKNHTSKSIVFLKLTPGLAVPGLILTGFMKIPFKRFFKTAIIFNVVAAVIFTLAGYYSGIAISSVMKYLKLQEYILLILAILIIIVYLIIKFIYKKVEKIN